LHDIGQLPLWMLVFEEESKHRKLPPPGWEDNIPMERDYCGMDHCRVGRWMAVSWNFMPSFVDVFEFHHYPERAQHDPYLVGIVAAADQFLWTQAPPANPPAPAVEPVAGEESAEVAETPSFLQACLPRLAEGERTAVMEMLQTEYIHLLPLVQLGLASATSTPSE